MRLKKELLPRHLRGEVALADPPPVNPTPAEPVRPPVVLRIVQAPPPKISPAHRQRHPPAAKTPREHVRALAEWSDTELDRAISYRHQALSHGLDDDEADRVIDALILRDRLALDMAMCIECRRLEVGGRCAAARAGMLPGAGRYVTPIKAELIRCPSFRA